MTTGLKFVVLKGAAGWGDRLQCLLQAIKYAKATGRYLVVDWRDEEWSHDGLLTLDDYVDVTGVRHFPLHGFLALFRQGQIGGETIPKPWAVHMDNLDIRTLVYTELFQLPQHGETIHAIADFKQADFDADVVVYAGVGFRAFRFSDFSSLKPKAWMSADLKRYARNRGLVAKDYDVVHLRAGSKPWAGGQVALKSLAEKLDAQFPDLNAYIEQVQQAYAAACPDAASRKPVWVLSDSAWLASQWIEKTGIGQFLSHRMDSKMVASGIHELKAHDLQSAGLSKFDINLDSLRDFAVMLNARSVVSDGHSLFSSMAKSCQGSVHPDWLFD
ncbi:hypothetical protein NQT62_10375 [Limnobacter humi]|uniref:Glycosyl transferase n=1 Tax=Limnobacter humi TaxID=1778671 RepID=A0ABT1WH35_9BURK|nr:hypothetical protein [Limnobacter humi]MCQ8896835.1 hypothetical protein [Limnobacter humi]